MNILCDLNKIVEKELGITELEFIDDIFNETGFDEEIFWYEIRNMGSLFFPKYEDVKHSKTFHAKKVKFKKDGKSFIGAIKPKISGRDLDINAMLQDFKDTIKLANQQGVGDERK